MHTSYRDRFSKRIYLSASKSALFPQAWVYLKILHISLSSIELNAIWDAWTTLRRLKTEWPLAPAAMFQFTSWSNRNFIFDHCFLHKINYTTTSDNQEKPQQLEKILQCKSLPPTPRLFVPQWGKSQGRTHSHWSQVAGCGLKSSAC